MTPGMTIRDVHHKQNVMNIKTYIPNTITCLNLLCGCIAVFLAFHSGAQHMGLYGFQWAWIFIGAAAVFDFCDGLSARLLGAYSPMGKELDSLSDLVSFGVAPGMLIYNTISAFSDCHWVAYIAILIPVMGELRLARFNIDDRQTTSFLGMPIPANAIFWIGFTAWIHRYGYPGDIVMAVLIVVMSLLMVMTRMKMFSLKFKNFDIRENMRRYIIIIAAIFFVVMYGIAGLAYAILFYVVLSFVRTKYSA